MRQTTMPSGLRRLLLVATGLILIYVSSELATILKKIEKLTQTPGYIYALGEIVSEDTFLGGFELSASFYLKRMSHREASFLIGLCIKQKSFDDVSQPSATQRKDWIKQTLSLLKELRDLYDQQFKLALADPSGGKKDSWLSKRKLFKKSKEAERNRALMTQFLFYEVSLNHDFQYVKMAPKLYQFDKAWLASKGFDLDHINPIFESFLELREMLHYSHTNPEIFESDLSLDLIAQFLCGSDLIFNKTNPENQNNPLTRKSVDAFFDLFKAELYQENASLRTPDDFNILNFKPLIKIDDEACFLLTAFSLAEAIYKNPGYLMMQDPSYAPTALRHRTQAITKITYQYFQKIFKKFAFKSIHVRRSEKAVARIDVMGVIGNVAVIAPTKVKKVSIETNEGSLYYIEDRLIPALQAAYDRGLKARELILKSQDYQLVDSQGQEIKLPSRITQVYILCPVADIYPTVLPQAIKDLKKKEGDPYPLPLSLIDLDVLTEYLPDAYDFTFYLKERIDGAGSVVASNEMISLAYYSLYGQLADPSIAQAIPIQEYAEIMAWDYLSRQDRLEEIEKPDLIKRSWSNAAYEKMVAELKTQTDNPRLTDAIFFLKMMSEREIDELMKAIAIVRKRSIKDVVSHHASRLFKVNDSVWGVSYIMDSNLADLKQELENLAKINKHRHQASCWLAIGAVTGESEIAQAALLRDSGAESPEEIEELMEEYILDEVGNLISLDIHRNKVKTAKKSEKKTKKRLRKLRRQAQRKNKKKKR